MSFVKPANKVVFINEKTEAAFNVLPENNVIKKAVKRVIGNLKENAFCGEPISKRLIPKEYIKKYGIDNLWWYPLSKGWRLVYTTTSSDQGIIIALIIEYFDHKNYERKFGY